MRRGFSLSELLVVMATIAVLSALLLGGIRQVRTLARASVCASAMRQIGVALGTYAGDNQGVMPPAYANPGNFADTPYRQWFGALVGLLGEDGTVSGGKIAATRIYVCPDGNHVSRTLDAYGLSYGYNADGGYPTNTWVGLRPQAFAPTGSRVLLGERWGINAGGSADWDWGVSPPYSLPVMVPPRRPGNPFSLRLSHGGRSNYLFLDLHVETLAPYQRCGASAAATTNIWRGRG